MTLISMGTYQNSGEFQWTFSGKPVSGHRESDLHLGALAFNSPTTTLSIGLDSPGDDCERVQESEVRLDNMQHNPRQLISTSGSFHADVTSHHGKRKRSGQQFATTEPEPDVVLALGQRNSHQQMDTVLGLTHAVHDVSNSTPSDTIGMRSRRTSSSTIPFSFNNDLNSREKSGLGSDVYLHLGSDNATYSMSNSFIGHAEPPNSEEHLLRLGLPGNGTGFQSYKQLCRDPKDTGNCNGSLLGLGHVDHHLETVGNRSTFVPVVDEGSSSARWMKSGGNMPRLLAPSQPSQTHMDNNNYYKTRDVGPIEQDLSLSAKPSSGTTSTSGASGLSDKASKICKFKGCGKGARGASGLCIAHGGGRRCERPGCNKGAEGRTVYCKAHGGGKRCQSLGCTKSAEGKTDYCIAHGGGRRCSYPGGCTKAARGRSGLCIRHGGGKRCKQEGCTKSAEGYTGLCISHGGGRRCQADGCGKGAQGSTNFCKAHGGGKRCMIQGCTKGAEGSTPLCKAHGGGKRCMHEGGGLCPKSVHGGTLFCVAHGGGKRCASQGCTKSARGRTNYCVRHGGGKRCKMENCGKSAQGSTDFCKAHGGGKRCTWGQEGSQYGPENCRGDIGELAKTPCERFARGKLGLCAAHSGLVLDGRVHGAHNVGNSLAPGISPGLFRGLASGQSGNTSISAKSLSSSETTSISGYSNKTTSSAAVESFGGLQLGTDAWKIQEDVEDCNESGRHRERDQAHCKPPWVPLQGHGTSASTCWPSVPVHPPYVGNAQSGVFMNKFIIDAPSSRAPLIPPRVLVPPAMQSFENPTNAPEGRVRGGGLLAMLTRGDMSANQSS